MLVDLRFIVGRAFIYHKNISLFAHFLKKSNAQFDGELLHVLLLSCCFFLVDLCMTTLTVCFNQFLNEKLHLNKMQI